MRDTKHERAVTPVIGIILMVALTVILAAVTGVFVLGIAENMSQGVQAGADIKFDNNQVEVIYITNRNAEYLNASFSGWGNEGKARLNNTGSRAILSTTDFTTTGSGMVWGSGLPTSELPSNGDVVNVVVVGVRGGESTVILSDSGRI